MSPICCIHEWTWFWTWLLCRSLDGHWLNFTNTHRRTGPVSFRGAEISCPNTEYFIHCFPENQLVLPELHYFFGPENGFVKRKNRGGGLHHTRLVRLCHPPRITLFRIDQSPVFEFKLILGIFVPNIWMDSKLHSIVLLIHVQDFEKAFNNLHGLFGKLNSVNE